MDLNERLSHALSADTMDNEAFDNEVAEWHVVPFRELTAFVERLQKEQPVAVRQLDWEKATSEGVLSEYFTDVNISLVAVVRKAYNIATELLAAMDCPERYKLRLTSTYIGETKQKNLLVDTAMFDDKTIPMGERVDLFCGATILEALQTSFTPVGAYDEIKNPTIRTIAAIIELQRLENICVKRTPGYQSFLQKLKNYRFDCSVVDTLAPATCPAIPGCPSVEGANLADLKRYLRLRRADLPLAKDDVDFYLDDDDCFLLYRELGLQEEDCFLYLDYLMLMVRMPDRLKPEDIRYYAYYLMEAHQCLTPFPETWSDVKRAAVAIFSLLKQMRTAVAQKKMQADERVGYMCKVPVKQRNRGESTMTDPGESRTMEADAPAPNVGNSNDESETKSNARQAKKAGKQANGPTDQNDNLADNDDNQDAGKQGNEQPQLSDRQIDELANEEDKLLKEFPDWTQKISSISNQVIRDHVHYSHYLFSNAQVIEGSVKFGTNRNIKFMVAQPDKVKYRLALENVRNLVASVRKAFKAHYRHTEVDVHNLRNGTLDPTKLAEARQGVQNVYMRHAKTITDKVSVALVVDESASMKTDKKMESAREVAILLSEAIKDVPEMELFVYGHHADIGLPNTTNINVYRDKTHTVDFALGNTKADGCNRDGVAFKEIALDIRRQTENKILMVVISDGNPNAENYRGMQAVEDTQRQVREIERMGFSVMQVSLKGGVDSKLMFRHWVTFTNMSLLAHDISQVVKMAVARLAERRVELF